MDPVSGELQTESALDAFEPAALANELFAASNRSDPSGVLLDPTTGDAQGLGLCATTDVDDFGDPFCVGEGELAVYQVTASVDGTELLATGVTGELKLTGDVLVLDPASGEVTGTFRIEPTDPDFEIFTEEWTFGKDISGYSAIDRQTGDRLYTGPFSEPIEVSQSGGLIAMGQRTSDLVVLDTNTWEEFLTIEGSGRIRGLAFDQSETKVAVADVDTMYVVDLDAGIIVQQMRLPGVSDIHWLDDETVLVGTNNGLFGIVSLSTEAFLDRTRASLRRSFTADECAAYRIDPCPTLDEMRGA